MRTFFSDEMGHPIEWFGVTHFILILGFILSVVLLWFFLPKIRQSSYEKLFRLLILLLVVIFEWKVFESRILTTSIFRMPLCAVALYGLAYSIAFKKEKIFKINYFYAFGSIISFLFYDTPWGLDRWNGWTFFGAHAMIAWLAVYGYRVFDYKPSKKDLKLAMLILAGIALVSGYATLRFGGSDELFLLTPPVDFLNVLINIHYLVYLIVFSSFIAFLMFLMYTPIYFTEKTKQL